MSISTKEELQFLLHRDLEIEKKFELMSAWEGFVTVDSYHRKMVLILARESNKHALDLKKMLKTLGLQLSTDEFVQEIFDFEGMLDSEILYKIIRQDEIAADIYSELVKKIDPKLVRSLSGIDNTSFFIRLLKKLLMMKKDMLVW